MVDNEYFDRIERTRMTRYLPALYHVAQAVANAVLMEGPPGADSCPYGEKYLQVMWNELQMADDLRSEEGNSVKILSGGLWNVGAGPDFKSASLLVNGVPVKGDVEIHRKSSDWFSHGHGEDRRYDGVVLHVVWTDNVPGGVRPGISTLVMPRCLRPGWQDVLRSLEVACYPYARQVPSGDCSIKWAMAADGHVRELLGSAGLARFSAKASAMMSLVSEKGCEQALYECIFESLGYKNNRAQFRRVAQCMPLELLQSAGGTMERAAMLFGCAGLIPDPTMVSVLPEWSGYVSRLWDIWWNMGLKPLDGLEWGRGGSRPFNSPFRRMAAGLQLLEAVECRPAEWLLSKGRDSADSRSLLKCFDAFCAAESTGGMGGASGWCSLRDFCHEIRPTAQLVGRSRLNDMLVNVFLPFLHGIAENRDGQDCHASRMARMLYVEMPLLQENRMLKEAVCRFFMPPSRAADIVRTACEQQGVLDIYRNFCCALGNSCHQCPFSGNSVGE